MNFNRHIWYDNMTKDDDNGRKTLGDVDDYMNIWSGIQQEFKKKNPPDIFLKTPPLIVSGIKVNPKVCD